MNKKDILDQGDSVSEILERLKKTPGSSYRCIGGEEAASIMERIFEGQDKVKRDLEEVDIESVNLINNAVFN